MRESAIVLGLTLLLVGCSTKERPSALLSAGSGATPFAAIDPATAGSISGAVYLDGRPGKLPSINMQSEPACAKLNSSGAPAQAVAVASNGALADVVVYVRTGLANYRFAQENKPVPLDQKGCLYEPRVVALRTGQFLEIRNSDATIHNVHALPRNNDEWNKAQRAGAPALEISFPRPELAIPLMCNVHPWMRAFVFVFDHPYFAVTAADGKFVLPNLPPGTYTVEAWQEKLGTQSQSVTIMPRESKEISFRFATAAAGS